MATAISTLIGRVRTNINDTDAAGFSPDDLVMYFNYANRFLRRLVLQYKPRLLASSASGTQPTGSATITLPSSLLKILSVRIDGKMIYPMDLEDVEDLTKTGTPEAYAQTGFTTLQLIPIPSENIAYAVSYVPTGTDLTISDNVPWPTEFDDVLMEYIVIRCGMKNEFSITQETSVMSEIASQVISILNSMEPSVDTVRGYFDDDLSRGRVRGYR